MQLILVSGLSGSGKSIALNVLEDSGYYCVDNLPATLLLEVADFLGEAGHDRAAVSVDARSAAVAALPENIAKLRSRGVDCRVLYLEANSPSLLRRFSETRRAHPLAGSGLTLSEAIGRERTLLADVAALAHRIDTSELQPRLLQNWIKDLLALEAGSFTLLFESFAHRAGIRRSPGRTAATLPWPSAAPAGATAPSTSPSGSPRPFARSGASCCAIAASLAKAHKRNAGVRAFPAGHGALSRRSPAVADLRAALHGNGEGLPARRHALRRMPDPRWRGSRRAGDPGGDRLPCPYRRLGHAAARHAAYHRPRRASLSHPRAAHRARRPRARLDRNASRRYRRPGAGTVQVLRAPARARDRAAGRWALRAAAPVRFQRLGECPPRRNPSACAFGEAGAVRTDRRARAAGAPEQSLGELA